jgi:hypothetical protein
MTLAFFSLIIHYPCRVAWPVVTIVVGNMVKTKYQYPLLYILSSWGHTRQERGQTSKKTK